MALTTHPHLVLGLYGLFLGERYLYLLQVPAIAVGESFVTIWLWFSLHDPLLPLNHMESLSAEFTKVMYYCIIFPYNILTFVCGKENLLYFIGRIG